MTRLALSSDFNDYYDHALDEYRGIGPKWDRLSVTKRTRAQDLNLLRELGLDPPAHGPACRLHSSKVVVYDSMCAHRGEGKRLEMRSDVDEDAFCSEFIECSGPPVSYRVLLIGDRRLFLRYESTDAWRSNMGEVCIEFVEKGSREWRMLQLLAESLPILQAALVTPLLAVDFVLGEHSYTHFRAVDLNTAPGLSGSPVQETMKADEVATLLKKRWEEIRP